MSDAAEYAFGSPHLEAARDAWREFKGSVEMQTFCLSADGCDEDEPHLPLPHAWLYAVWKSILDRFAPYNLERLFRPLKAERRQRVHDMCDYVFWCGDDRGAEWWAEADALVAEFGIDFPPRGYEPMSVTQLVGQQMGMSPERIAEIEAGVKAA